MFRTSIASLALVVAIGASAAGAAQPDPWVVTNPSAQAYTFNGYVPCRVGDPATPHCHYWPGTTRGVMYVTVNNQTYTECHDLEVESRAIAVGIGFCYPPI